MGNFGASGVLGLFNRLLSIIFLTLAISGLTAIVTPAYGQNLHNVLVVKKVNGPSGAPQLTNLSFNVVANCTPAASPSSFPVNNYSGIGTNTFLVSYGTSCVVSEVSTMPAMPNIAKDYCIAQGGGAPVWLAPSYDLNGTNGGNSSSTPLPFNVGGAGAALVQVGITNRWRCQPVQTGILRVRKTATGPTGSPALTGLGFGVNVNCTTPLATPNGTVLANTGNISFAPQIGASCTVTEAPQPTFPPSAKEYCLGQGGTPEWLPPVYTPTGTTTPPTVTIGTVSSTVLITNRWRCKPNQTVKLEVRKRVDGPSGSPQLTSLTFGVNVNCTSPSSNTNITVNNGSGVGSVTLPVQTGSSCTVTENALPPFPLLAQEFCGPNAMPEWDPPLYNPGISTTPPTVLIGSSLNLVKILNMWKCKPKPMSKLVVRKWMVNPVGMMSLGSLGFNVNTNCTPASTPASAVVFSGSSMTFAVPTGSTCMVTESASMPAFPTSAQTFCGPNATPVWDPPLYSSSGNSVPSVTTVSGSTQTVDITNKWHCKPNPTSTLEVRKRVVSQPGMPPLTNLNFGINANCTPALSTPNQILNNGNGTASVFFTVQNGTSCTVSESSNMPTFPAAATQFCGPNATPQWNAPIYTPNGTTTPPTITVSGSNAVINISNSWKCVPNTGKLHVQKIMSNPAGYGSSFPVMQFPVSVNCTPVSPPSQNIFNVSVNVFNVQVGSTCTVSESSTLPALPASAVQFCGQNAMPQWNTPSFGANGSTVTITATPTLVQVFNSWKCVPKMGSLTINKITSWEGPGSSSTIAGQVYNIHVACTPSISQASPLLLGGGLGYTINNIPSGTSCFVQENTPQVPNAGYDACEAIGMVFMWDPPLYNTGSGFSPTPPTVTILGGSSTVTIKNHAACYPKPKGTLVIQKSLTTQSILPQWPAASWLVMTNCTPTGSSPSVAVNTFLSSNAVISSTGAITAPLGAHCTVTEPQPTMAFPAGIVSYCAMPIHGGGVPMWNPPTYTYNGNTTTTPPTVYISSTGNFWVTVNNSWKCSSTVTTVTIDKVLQGPVGSTGWSHADFAGMNFVVTPTCAVSTTPTSLSLGYSTSWLGSFTVPSGTICSGMTETQPLPFPQSVLTYCQNQNNQIPMWETPAFSPSFPTTMSGAAASVVLTNKWKCASSQKVAPKKKRFKLPFKVKLGIPIPGVGTGGSSKPDTPEQPRDTPGRP